MTVIVGVVNLFATILAVYLMDRAGRRVLFLTSQFGMGVACVVIVIAAITGYDVVLAGMVVAYVALFAIGLGPIPWMSRKE